MIAAARQSSILDARGAPIIVNRAPGSLYEGASTGQRQSAVAEAPASPREAGMISEL